MRIPTPKQIGRRIKWWFQKRTRGFSDCELWSLDRPLAEFALPRLRAFRNTTSSYPGGLMSFDEWMAELDLMILAMDYIVRDEDDIAMAMPFDDYCKEARRRDEIKQRGCELFGKRFLHLWN